MFDGNSWKGVPAPREEAALKACLQIHEIFMQVLKYPEYEAAAMKAVELYGAEAIAKRFSVLLAEDAYTTGSLPLCGIDFLRGFYPINAKVPQRLIRHGVHKKLMSRTSTLR